MAYVPQRGDVMWLDLDPQMGHEQAGRRPVLVLSIHSYNSSTGLAIVAPLTNQVKGYPFELAVPEGFGVTGVVLCDQTKNQDWRRRRASYLGRLPDDFVSEVAEIFVSLLPLS